MSSDKKILIIGGLGYIGSVIFELLEANNYEVKILDNHIYKSIDPFNSYINVDIRDYKKIHDVINDFDIIIHLAGIVGDPACLVDTDLTIEINCMGTRNIAEICNKLDKFLIHSSTCSIYGSEPNKLVTEKDDSFPIDFYGQTKYTQERLVRNLCKDNSCILRFGTVYGLSPRMRYDLVVNSFIARALTDKKLTVFGGDQERPFLHIQDIAYAIEHVINNDLRGVFNLRSENLNIKELSEIIKELTNCEIEINENIVDKRSYIVDNSKFKSTGFEFKHSIEDAIEELKISPSIFNVEKAIYSNLKLAENLMISRSLKEKKIEVIKGDLAVDDRGKVSFVNEFNFYGVKRFYQIQNFSTQTIRAWHAHKDEGKYVFVSEGSAIVAAVKLDDFDQPSKELVPKRYILSDKSPNILFIPPGYANGFRPLEDSTSIIFFSTKSLNESHEDDFRFPAEYWGNEIWEVENR